MFLIWLKVTIVFYLLAPRVRKYISTDILLTRSGNCVLDVEVAALFCLDECFVWDVEVVLVSVAPIVALVHHDTGEATDLLAVAQEYLGRHGCVFSNVDVVTVDDAGHVMLEELEDEVYRHAPTGKQDSHVDQYPSNLVHLL